MSAHTLPRAHLKLVPAAPAPKPALRKLISSAAQRNEAQGKRPYDCKPVDPKQIPAAYLSMTAFPRRVERKTWRTPVAVVVGTLVGLAALGVGAGFVASGVTTLLVGAAVALSDGWTR
jgi:hypothetical protein